MASVVAGTSDPAEMRMLTPRIASHDRKPAATDIVDAREQNMGAHIYAVLARLFAEADSDHDGLLNDEQVTMVCEVPVICIDEFDDGTAG